MDIRNFKKKRIGKYKFFIIIGIVLLLFFFFYKIKYFFSFSDATLGDGEILSGKQLSSYKKGDKIKFAGELLVDNHFPLYTHVLVKSKDILGLKSTSINLNEYLGFVEIVGEITEINKGLPIVNVNALKLSTPGLIIKGNTYFFVKDSILFDFTDQTQLSANKSGKNIIIFYNKKPLFFVERFLCSKIVKDKDCNSIIQGYLNSQKEFFNTDAGYIFYKHDDATWAVFDDIFGYMFKNISDDMMLDISSMVKIVNKDFVLTQKKDLIKEQCKNTNDHMKTIDFSKLNFTDPYFLILSIEGMSKGQKKFFCNLTFDLWNEWTLTEVNFEVQ